MDLPQTIDIARRVIQRSHMKGRISFKEVPGIAMGSTLINANASVNIGTTAILEASIRCRSSPLFTAQ